MMIKINRLILVLYNLCGIALVALAAGGMAPPVGQVPTGLIIFCSLPFIGLIAAHLYRFCLKKTQVK